MASLYTFPKPIVELSLEPGGSLLPNTTYYFGAFYRGFLQAGQSPLSDQVSITTDTTNLSIRVKIKWDTGGGVYSYDRPVPSFWTANYARFHIIWNTTDMTDGAGNWTFVNYETTTGADVYIVTGDGTTYNVVYSTAPVYNGTNFLYVYIPERFIYQAAGVNPLTELGWTLTDGCPILYAGSASDTWATMMTALASSGYTNYKYLDKAKAEFSGYLSIYSSYAVTWNDLTLELFYGIFISEGTHNRCTISTLAYRTGGAISGKIYIANGDNNFLRGQRYRQDFIVDGEANTITSFANQIQIATNNITKRNYVNCFIITNGMNGQANFNLYNSLLYSQINDTGDVISNIYQSTDTATWGLVSNPCDLTMMRFYLTSPATTLTIKNYRIDTNRATSEGISYATERKPRILWSDNSGAGASLKTLDLKNSVDFYISDEDNNFISGVTVKMQNDFETVTGTTDADGYFSDFILIRRAVQHASYSTPTYQTTWTDEEEVEITISKKGYETYSTIMTLTEKKTSQITLKSSIPVMIAPTGVVIKQDPTNSKANRGDCIIN